MINTFNKKIVPKDKESVKGSVVAEQDSVLVSKVRPGRGVTHLLKSDFIVTNGFSVLNTCSKNHLQVICFIVYWNKDFHYQMLQLATGSTYPTIDDEDVLNYLIPSVDNDSKNLYVKEMNDIYKVLSNIECQIEKSQNLLKKLTNQDLLIMFLQSSILSNIILLIN